MVDTVTPGAFAEHERGFALCLQTTFGQEDETVGSTDARKPSRRDQDDDFQFPDEVTHPAALYPGQLSVTHSPAARTVSAIGWHAAQAFHACLQGCLALC